MKLFILSLLVLLSISLNAQSFTKKATSTPTLTQEGKNKHWCPVCGMSIKMFYKTSHTSKLPNKTNRQYCSMRCLAVDIKKYKINLDEVKVVDSKSEKIILAKDAYYVVDSIVPGTMAKVSKLAFAKKSDALKFIEEYEGKLATFDEAFKMAQDSLKSDIAMVTMKKKKKIYPMGKKIFDKKCDKTINLNDYLEINDLKASIKEKNLCKELKNEKQFQAVALYLWEVKRFGDAKDKDIIKVEKNEKCPVCGMFIYKYPRWAAQIFYKDSHLSFDGVKDMMKFYFNPAKWGEDKNHTKKQISKMVVTDYYSQKAIDSKSAFYVIGSDVYGPMGHELIPFDNLESAKRFKIDHKGKKIIKFKDIVEKELYKLDE